MTRLRRLEGSASASAMSVAAAALSWIVDVTAKEVIVDKDAEDESVAVAEVKSDVEEEASEAVAVLLQCLVFIRWCVVEVASDADADAEAVAEEEPESVVEVESTEAAALFDLDEPPVLVRAAISGPGNVYSAFVLKTSGSKMPGSVSLYAPGSETKSFSSGTPLSFPPTVICEQLG